MNKPAALGYRFPAEWEPHAATWLSWPHNEKTWPGKFAPVPPLFAHFARTLARFEPVHILAGGDAVMAVARRLVGDMPGVTLHDIPTNDCWIRDHGPTFLVGPAGAEPALVDWQFNAWGEKYPRFDLDNLVPSRIAALTGRQRYSPGVIFEGGAVETNGQGLILAAEQCLLNPNRNPGATRADFERLMADYLGAKKVLWLQGEIAGDDTDGHVDQLARFVGPRTVVVAVQRDPNDVNHASLRENFERLKSMTDQEDRPLEVVPLPLPRPLYYDNRRMPASYANFYIANGAVIVPQFEDPADVEALALLRTYFSDREVIGLAAVDLVWGLGAYHCATQQEPANAA